VSYATLAQANDTLESNQEWSRLSDEDKNRHLITAALWLNFNYEWPGKPSAECSIKPEPEAGYPYSFPFAYPADGALKLLTALWPRLDCCDQPVCDMHGCPIYGIPDAVKYAQILAVQQSLVTPLFSTPTTTASQSLTRKKVKAGPIEIDKEWTEPERGAQGQLIINEIDAVLANIANRKGTTVGRLPNFF